MIKLQFKLPQTLISRGFTRRIVLHAPAFQQKGILSLIVLDYNTIILIVELICCLLFSTGVVENGLSTVRRIVTDWRANMLVLYFNNIIKNIVTIREELKLQESGAEESSS